MKNRKLFALVLALALIVSLFAGCGANHDGSAPMENGAYAPEVPAGGEAEITIDSDLSDTTASSPAAMPENMKIITTVYLSAETNDLDVTLSGIDSKVSQLGGYMEAQEIYNGSSYATYRTRNASMVIRIPAEKTNQFISMVSDNANIISKSISTQNVTLSYVALESRITALKTEETRLLELLAKAENMEDLLLIESRLTEVRTELENITSQLRVMDNKVTYSTIHLELVEVKEYTEVEEPETFGERVASGFSQSMKNLWKAIVEVTIFFITRIPYLLPAAVVAVIVILCTRRKRQKKTQPPQKPDEKKDAE